jgi:hypothetical protein
VSCLRVCQSLGVIWTGIYFGFHHPTLIRRHCRQLLFIIELHCASPAPFHFITKLLGDFARRFSSPNSFSNLPPLFVIELLIESHGPCLFSTTFHQRIARRSLAANSSANLPSIFKFSSPFSSSKLPTAFHHRLLIEAPAAFHHPTP